MSDAIKTFFSAWGETDDAARSKAIGAVMADGFTYIDPRVPAPLSDLDALADYIGMFSQNAPGWTARVLRADEVHGHVRALVAFAGPGPDGAEMVQHGTYFAQMDDDRILRIVGFVGTGALE